MKLLTKLWKRAFSYLHPGVEDDDNAPDLDSIPDPEIDSGDDADIDTGDEADPEPDDDAPDEPDDPAPARQSRAQREIIKTRERAQKAERELAELRGRQQTPPAPPQVTQEQIMFQQEEAALRDPNTDPQTRWQIESNRTLRANQRMASEALQRAQDTEDRTAYRLAAADKPLMKRYEDRVEKEVTRLRQQGQNVSRQAVYLFLLGQDVDQGKTRTKSAAKPAAKPGALPASERGKPVGARSDVGGKQGRSEREKRAARLANVNL